MHLPAAYYLAGHHKALLCRNDPDLHRRVRGGDGRFAIRRLHVPPQLRLTLASTNFIESAFSIVETNGRSF